MIGDLLVFLAILLVVCLMLMICRPTDVRRATPDLRRRRRTVIIRRGERTVI